MFFFFILTVLNEANEPVVSKVIKPSTQSEQVQSQAHDDVIAAVTTEHCF